MKPIIAITILILCLSFAGWSEDSTSVPLSAEDEKLASSLVAALSDEDFDKRSPAQEQLIKLVFSDPKKAAAWDNWLGAAKRRVTETEALSNWPSDVAIRTRLSGRYKATIDYERSQCEIEISIDGSFKIVHRRQRSVLIQGKYIVQADGTILLKGTANEHDGWEYTSTLQNGQFIIHVKSGASNHESVWIRMTIEEKEQRSKK